MRIHSFRRKEAYEVNLAPRGSLTEQLVRFYLLTGTKETIVADVTDDRHIDLLLNVPEAYREYDETDTSIPVAADPDAARRAAEEARRTAELREAEQKQQIKDAQEKARKEAAEAGTLIGSSVQPSTVSLTGSKTVALGDVVAAAHRASGLSVEEWNELQDDEREALISNMVTTMENEAEQAEADEMEAIRLKAEQDAQAAAQAEKEAAEAAAAAKFTLVAGDQTVIDLKAMDDAALREFAKKYEVTLPQKIKGDQIRQVIIDALAPVDAAGDASKGQ